MSEIICRVIDEYVSEPTGEEIVRCRDCVNVSFDGFGGGWCCENRREIKPWDYCCWGNGGDTE